MTTQKHPPAPTDLPKTAKALWLTIVKSVDSNYFSAGDLVLLRALVVAQHQKTVVDTLVDRDGPILSDGKANPAAKLSNQYAATMASLSAKLRLCKSSVMRAESATLKKSLHGGVASWEDDNVSEYFS